MSNHVYFIWQPLQHYTLTQIQTSFTTYTAKMLLKKLSQSTPGILQEIKVNKYDRKHQIWKRESLSIELFTENTFMQKLNYIHQNPVAARLVPNPEDYKYSSAKFYELGIYEFGFIIHFSGN